MKLNFRETWNLPINARIIISVWNKTNAQLVFHKFVKDNLNYTSKNTLNFTLILIIVTITYVFNIFILN